jgi:hypothetical protein
MILNINFPAHFQLAAFAQKEQKFELLYFGLFLALARKVGIIVGWRGVEKKGNQKQQWIQCK